MDENDVSYLVSLGGQGIAKHAPWPPAMHTFCTQHPFCGASGCTTTGNDFGMTRGTPGEHSRATQQQAYLAGDDVSIAARYLGCAAGAPNGCAHKAQSTASSCCVPAQQHALVYSPTARDHIMGYTAGAPEYAGALGAWCCEPQLQGVSFAAAVFMPGTGNSSGGSFLESSRLVPFPPVMEVRGNSLSCAADEQSMTYMSAAVQRVLTDSSPGGGYGVEEAHAPREGPSEASVQGHCSDAELDSWQLQQLLQQSQQLEWEQTNEEPGCPGTWTKFEHLLVADREESVEGDDEVFQPKYDIGKVHTPLVSCKPMNQVLTSANASPVPAALQSSPFCGDQHLPAIRENDAPEGLVCIPGMDFLDVCAIGAAEEVLGPRYFRSGPLPVSEHEHCAEPEWRSPRVAVSQSRAPDKKHLVVRGGEAASGEGSANGTRAANKAVTELLKVLPWLRAARVAAAAAAAAAAPAGDGQRDHGNGDDGRHDFDASEKTSPKCAHTAEVPSGSSASHRLVPACPDVSLLEPPATACWQVPQTESKISVDVWAMEQMESTVLAAEVQGGTGLGVAAEDMLSTSPVTDTLPLETKKEKLKKNSLKEFWARRRRSLSSRSAASEDSIDSMNSPVSRTSMGSFVSSGVTSLANRAVKGVFGNGQEYTGIKQDRRKSWSSGLKHSSSLQNPVVALQSENGELTGLPNQC